MIIKTFNYVYFILLALVIITTIVLSYIFKNKSDRSKKVFMYSLGLFNIVFFILYKIYLSTDDYPFVIWDELPFQLCNINMFLIPIALFTKNKFITAFSFYLAPLGALMAITFPLPEFTNNSIFLLRNIGFYGTHIIILVMGLLLLPLGYIKPKVKDIFYLYISALVISFGAFLLNMFFKGVTGFETNYFYTMHPAGNFLLEAFYDFIPIKYLYLLPALLILTVYVLVVNGIYKLYLYIFKNNDF